MFVWRARRAVSFTSYCITHRVREGLPIWVLRLLAVDILIFGRCAIVATVEAERHRQSKADKKFITNNVQTRLISKDSRPFRRVVCDLRTYSTKP